MKRFLLILTVISSLTLSAAAQGAWNAVDTHQYNDETVVYATLQVNDHAVGADNTDYDVAAFVDDECRDVVIEAAQGENGQSVFVLRVHGNRDADAGKPVRFEIRYSPRGLMLVYDVTPSLAVNFNGESWGQPSAPVVLSGKGYEGDATFAFNPAVINVSETVDIVSLFQGGTMPKYESIELSAEGIVRLDGTVAKGLTPGTVTFSVRFSESVTLSNTITVLQGVELQHLEYAFDNHPYNHETVQMTLTPVPADANFDITDLRFRYHADYDWQEVWNIVDFELVSREPIIYNVTLHNKAVSHLLKKSVGMLRIKEFVCPHQRDKVFRIREIDDVVGIARQHVHCPDSLSADLKFNHLVRPDLPLLNQAMTGNDDKEFPLAVVPVLALGDSRL